MKKCPHCHASIEESAHFCLYCMTSLEEKQTDGNPIQRRGIRIAAIVSAIVLLLAAGVWLGSVLSSDSPETQDVTGAVTTTTALGTTAAPPAMNDAVGRPTQTTATEPMTTISTGTTATAASVGTDTYTYRDATRDDVYLELTIALPDDVLVITGVLTPSSDGVYRVPNTIDGKRVVAIAPEAFSGEDVRVVILPDNVSTVNNGAFSACPNLTDIYFIDSVFTYSEAFAPVESRTGTLTIHCPQDCDNRNFRYYRNIASDWFGAEYREWNGGELT